MVDQSLPTRVFDLKPVYGEAIKPSELIQITGHQNLTLSARRAITILWHNAHRQGIEEGKYYTIELADLRTDGHKGKDTIEDSIEVLMQTVLKMKLKGKAVRRVQFLGGNDMDDPGRPSGTLKYSFDPLLVDILRDSAVWGKIAIPVLMAFSSKYAVSLYEHACQWTGLQHKLVQDFTLDELRLMMGVEKGKYSAFGDLNIHVLKPAAKEINALAPFNVQILPVKEGRRVVGVKIGWGRKNIEELQEAFRESQRSKVGRKARLSGLAEAVVGAVPSLSSHSRAARLTARKDVDRVIDDGDEPSSS